MSSKYLLEEIVGTLTTSTASSFGISILKGLTGQVSSRSDATDSDFCLFCIVRACHRAPSPLEAADILVVCQSNTIGVPQCPFVDVGPTITNYV